MSDFLFAIALWISAETGMAVPSQMPQVQYVATEQFAEGNHQVGALYGLEDRIIYLREGWKPDTPFRVSVLVHEMVHHFQAYHGLMKTFRCPQESEIQAYGLQVEWLQQHGDPDPWATIGTNEFTVVFMRASCSGRR